jgi:hypothetical protein
MPLVLFVVLVSCRSTKMSVMIVSTDVSVTIVYEITHPGDFVTSQLGKMLQQWSPPSRALRTVSGLYP